MTEQNSGWNRPVHDLQPRTTPHDSLETRLEAAARSELFTVGDYFGHSLGMLKASGRLIVDDLMQEHGSVATEAQVATACARAINTHLVELKLPASLVAEDLV